MDGANELKNAVAALDFDVVVASSGPWWPINKLSGVDPQMIEEAIKANVQSQVNLFSILGSKTKNYIVVNGSAALGLPFTGLTGVLANSQTVSLVLPSFSTMSAKTKTCPVSHMQ